MNMMVAAGAALAYGGLAAISLAMDRHHADIHGRGKAPDHRTRLQFRLAGWFGLALSFMACIAVRGWNTGPVLWCGMLTAAAILLTLLLQYAPRKAMKLAWASYLLALIGGMLLLLPTTVPHS